MKPRDVALESPQTTADARRLAVAQRSRREGTALAFSLAEFDILADHGDWMCTGAMRERAGTDAPAPAWPYPQFAVPARVKRAMRRSHRRFLRWR